MCKLYILQVIIFIEIFIGITETAPDGSSLINYTRTPSQVNLNDSGKISNDITDRGKRTVLFLVPSEEINESRNSEIDNNSCNDIVPAKGEKSKRCNPNKKVQFPWFSQQQSWTNDKQNIANEDANKYADQLASATSHGRTSNEQLEQQKSYLQLVSATDPKNILKNILQSKYPQHSENIELLLNKLKENSQTLNDNSNSENKVSILLERKPRGSTIKKYICYCYEDDCRNQKCDAERIVNQMNIQQKKKKSKNILNTKINDLTIETDETDDRMIKVKNPTYYISEESELFPYSSNKYIVKTDSNLQKNVDKVSFFKNSGNPLQSVAMHLPVAVKSDVDDHQSSNINIPFASNVNFDQRVFLLDKNVPHYSQTHSEKPESSYYFQHPYTIPIYGLLDSRVYQNIINNENNMDELQKNKLPNERKKVLCKKKNKDDRLQIMKQYPVDKKYVNINECIKLYSKDLCTSSTIDSSNFMMNAQQHNGKETSVQTEEICDDNAASQETDYENTTYDNHMKNLHESSKTMYTKNYIDKTIANSIAQKSNFNIMSSSMMNSENNRPIMYHDPNMFNPYLMYNQHVIDTSRQNMNDIYFRNPLGQSSMLPTYQQYYANAWFPIKFNKAYLCHISGPYYNPQKCNNYNVNFDFQPRIVEKNNSKNKQTKTSKVSSSVTSEESSKEVAKTKDSENVNNIKNLSVKEKVISSESQKSKTHFQNVDKQSFNISEEISRGKIKEDKNLENLMTKANNVSNFSAVKNLSTKEKMVTVSPQSTKIHSESMEKQSSISKEKSNESMEKVEVTKSKDDKEKDYNNLTAIKNTSTKEKVSSAKSQKSEVYSETVIKQPEINIKKDIFGADVYSAEEQPYDISVTKQSTTKSISYSSNSLSKNNKSSTIKLTSNVGAAISTDNFNRKTDSYDTEIQENNYMVGSIHKPPTNLEEELTKSTVTENNKNVEEELQLVTETIKLFNNQEKSITKPSFNSKVSDEVTHSMSTEISVTTKKSKHEKKKNIESNSRTKELSSDSSIDTQLLKSSKEINSKNQFSKNVRPIQISSTTTLDSVEYLIGNRHKSRNIETSTMGDEQNHPCTQHLVTTESIMIQQSSPQITSSIKPQTFLKAIINNIINAFVPNKSENTKKKSLNDYMSEIVSTKEIYLLPEIIDTPILKNVFTLPQVENMIVDSVKNLLSGITEIANNISIKKLTEDIIRSDFRNFVDKIPILHPTVATKTQKDEKFVIESTTQIPITEMKVPSNYLLSKVHNIVNRPEIGMQAARHPVVQNVIVKTVKHSLKKSKNPNNQNTEEDEIRNALKYLVHPQFGMRLSPRKPEIYTKNYKSEKLVTSKNGLAYNLNKFITTITTPVEKDIQITSPKIFSQSTEMIVPKVDKKKKTTQTEQLIQKFVTDASTTRQIKGHKKVKVDPMYDKNYEETTTVNTLMSDLNDNTSNYDDTNFEEEIVGLTRETYDSTISKMKSSTDQNYLEETPMIKYTKGQQKSVMNSIYDKNDEEITTANNLMTYLNDDTSNYDNINTEEEIIGLQTGTYDSATLRTKSSKNQNRYKNVLTTKHSTGRKKVIINPTYDKSDEETTTVNNLMTNLDDNTSSYGDTNFEEEIVGLTRETYDSSTSKMKSSTDRNYFEETPLMKHTKGEKKLVMNSIYDKNNEEITTSNNLMIYLDDNTSNYDNINSEEIMGLTRENYDKTTSEIKSSNDQNYYKETKSKSKPIKNEVSNAQHLEDILDSREKMPTKYYSPEDRILDYKKKHQTEGFDDIIKETSNEMMKSSEKISVTTKKYPDITESDEQSENTDYFEKSSQNLSIEDYSSEIVGNSRKSKKNVDKSEKLSEEDKPNTMAKSSFSKEDYSVIGKKMYKISSNNEDDESLEEYKDDFDNFKNQIITITTPSIESKKKPKIKKAKSQKEESPDTFLKTMIKSSISEDHPRNYLKNRKVKFRVIKKKKLIIPNKISTETSTTSFSRENVSKESFEGEFVTSKERNNNINDSYEENDNIVRSNIQIKTRYKDFTENNEMNKSGENNLNAIFEKLIGTTTQPSVETFQHEYSDTSDNEEEFENLSKNFGETKNSESVDINDANSKEISKESKEDTALKTSGFEDKVFTVSHEYSDEDKSIDDYEVKRDYNEDNSEFPKDVSIPSAYEINNKTVIKYVASTISNEYNVENDELVGDQSTDYQKSTENYDNLEDSIIESAIDYDYTEQSAEIKYKPQASNKNKIILATTKKPCIEKHENKTKESKMKKHVTEDIDYSEDMSEEYNGTTESLNDPVISTNDKKKLKQNIVNINDKMVTTTNRYASFRHHRKYNSRTKISTRNNNKTNSVETTTSNKEIGSEKQTSKNYSSEDDYSLLPTKSTQYDSEDDIVVDPYHYSNLKNDKGKDKNYVEKGRSHFLSTEKVPLKRRKPCSKKCKECNKNSETSQNDCDSSLENIFFIPDKDNNKNSEEVISTKLPINLDKHGRDPFYMGKLLPKMEKSEHSNDSDDKNLYYIGDGVKLPLTIKKQKDGSFTLSISDKICEHVLKRKCPCCLSTKGSIVRENTNTKTSEKRVKVSLNENEKRSSRKRSKRSTYQLRNATIKYKTQPFDIFVQKSNMTLKSNQIFNFINGNNNLLTSNLNTANAIKINNSDVENEGDFIQDLMNIDEVPEKDRIRIVLNALDNLLNIKQSEVHAIINAVHKKYDDERQNLKKNKRNYNN